MTDGISFGKNRNIDFKGFNGIRKQDFHVETGSKKEKLIKAFFENKRYNGDGDDILKAEDLKMLEQDIIAFANSGKSGRMGKKEAREFMQNFGLGSEFTREDLYEFLQEINADSDSVESTVTNADGTMTVKYKPDTHNTTKSEVYHTIDNKSVLLNDTVNYENGLSIKTYYDNSGKSLKHIQTQGAVTDEFEHRHNEYGIEQRLTKHIEKVGDNLYNVHEYVYDNSGNPAITKTRYDKSKEVVTVLGDNVKTITKYDSQGNKISHSMENCENSFDTVYEYNDDKTRTETTTWKNGTVTRAVYDSDDNLQSRVNVDENGNPQSYIHKVDKENDTWYGIVQAKYGITDHKATLEIVHRLKDAAGVKYSAVTIPDEIELPAEIALTKGNKAQLKDVFGIVNQTHNVQTHIDVVNSDNIPENVEVSADKKSVDYSSLPLSRQPEKQVDMVMIAQKYPQNSGNAYETVKSGDKWLVYDGQGRVEAVYNENPSESNDLPVESFYYLNDGSLSGYSIIQKEGQTTYESKYNGEGKLESVDNTVRDIYGNVLEEYFEYPIGEPLYTLNEYSSRGDKLLYTYGQSGSLSYIDKNEVDNKGNLIRTVELDASGKVKNFSDKSYDDLGRLKRNTIYNSDGTVRQVQVNKYKSSVVKSYFSSDVESYIYDSKGNLLH